MNNAIRNKPAKELSIRELKNLLEDAKAEKAQPYIRHKKRKEGQVRDAINQRGISEFHDIWDGKKTANQTEIVNKYVPTVHKYPEIAPPDAWPRQPYGTGWDFIWLVNQGLFMSHSYTIIVLLILYTIFK